MMCILFHCPFQAFSNKILTSARNGELIMWDLNKSGSSKYERRTRDHTRSIHALSYSPILGYYCMTGSADGDLRIWDLRDLSKSIMRIHHASSVRAVVCSPVHWQPLQAITASDNGSIHRWDLKVGQRGQLDRIPAAHSGPILTLDWSLPSSSTLLSAPIRQSAQGSWYSGSNVGLGSLDDIMPGSGGIPESAGGADWEGTGAGWLASGGMDKSVKVWDLTVPTTRSHISHTPTYTLHTAFPVRRVLWRPGYECELAVVSNADFGTTSNTDALSAVSNVTTASNAGVVAGLVSAISSPRIGTVPIGAGEDGPGMEGRAPSVARDGGSDPIEIWDVRRGYIAKWVVNKSAVEGGITDIAFADSHAIWAQHPSGTFSQLDLRHSSRPLDAISRTALSWDAAGTLAFVNDNPSRWDIPYDDTPEKRRNIQDRQGKIKSLGDMHYVPTSQTLGMIAQGSSDDFKMFAKLAKGYIYEGTDKRRICSHNAEIAVEAGKYEAAEAWLMLESLLTDLAADVFPTTLPSLRYASPGLSHSVSAPAAVPTVKTLPASTPHPPRSLSSDADILNKRKNNSPGSRSKLSDGRPETSCQQSPHRITPTSSTTSSPRRSGSGLPQVPASIFSSRESNAGLSMPMLPRLSSSYRRTSFTSPSIRSTHSESPSDSIKSHVSFRHAGEGVLSDSDSSGSDKGDGSGSESSKSEEGTSVRHPVSQNPHPRNNTAHPSPLSQIAVQETWTEDEKEDEDSPSPASTDSESSGASSRRKFSHSAKRGPRRGKTRSRSSTVASLAVSSPCRTLTKQGSHSSIRTVTAVTTPGLDSSHDGALRKDDTACDLVQQRPDVYKSSLHHHRARSEALSSEFLLDADRSAAGEAAPSLKNGCINSDDVRAIIEKEQKLHALGWEALRDAFESFADEGDVQICAFLSVVAPDELKVSKWRARQFLESYIEILSRLRLHASAAYMRRFVEADEIRTTTTLHTTVYTSCSRCRKPIVVPARRVSRAEKISGSYAYCRACRSNPTCCSICHMPVRALLFKCSICMHGGHQECYSKFYRKTRVAVEISTPPSSPHRRPHASPNPGAVPERARGRATSRSGSTIGGDSDGGSDDSAGLRYGDSRFGEDNGLFIGPMHVLRGYPCAAGCGHYCWITNEIPKS
ncbi:hypothetical protein AcV7_005082 [Taiwanofungus camphoratus]|nr:hypothetical protein AcV7_005082 [Antrodia cinnamomea]